MPSGDLVIGIDVGTSAIKCAAFELDGLNEPIRVQRRDAVTATPRPGWSEADPSAVEAAVLDALRALLEDVGPARVEAVGISATACGAWLVDGSLEPVRPAILWNDGRAAELTAQWQSDGRLERIFDISGNVVYPGYTLPVLAWLLREEPGSLARASSVLLCKDWLRARITGVVGTDESDASYVPFDIVRRRWSDELLELTSTTSCRNLLPDVLPAAGTAGVTEAGARRSGLRSGTPVSLGAADIVAGLVGAGVTRAGRAATILGTSAVSTVIADVAPFEPRTVGIMAASPGGRYARSLVNTSGSATLDWAAQLLTGGVVTRLLTLAAEAPEGSDGLLFLPYLSPTGTVSPRVDPHATGTLTGLRDHHGPAHVARAAVEGLALAVADCFAAMPLPVSEIVAVGGAARSDLLLQAIADATGKRVVRPIGEEFGTRGVALLAAWSIGAVSDLDDAAAALDREREFLPRPGTPLPQALLRFQAVATEQHSKAGLA